MKPRNILILLMAAVVVSVGQSTGGGGSSGNATSLQGVAVANTPPTDAQVLTYSATDVRWEPKAGGAGPTLPVVQPENFGAVHDGKNAFDGSITPLTNVATGTSTAPATPAIATAINGSVVDYIFQTNAAWSAAPATGTNQITVASGAGEYGLTVNDQTIAMAAPVASVGGTTVSSAAWNAAGVVITPSGGAIGHVGTPTTGYSTTNVTVNVPTGAVTGDTLVGYVAHYGTNVTWPAGWTLLFDYADSGGDRIAVGYIDLPASVPSSYTWTNSGAGATVGIVAYSNVGSVYGLSTLTSATAGFTSAAVADPICTAATGTGTSEQCGIIAGYLSATQVFVSYVAQSQPTNIWFSYGTDDSTAFTSMLTSAPCSTVGCRIQLGPYGYALTASYTLPPNITIQIQGAGAGITNTTNSFINGNTPPNANTGSRLMFLTMGLVKPAITIGGTAGVTSVAAWDQIADVGILAGAGKNRDGGGSDGIAILNWQGASLDRVIVSNFSGRGVYIDGVTAGTNKDYISVIGLEQVYTIWNGLAGKQVGSSVAVNNIETVSDNNGISEGNGGPAVKIQGNVQGFVEIDDLNQWDNQSGGTGLSEIEIDNNLSGGCLIEGNYFEDDVPEDSHAVTPGVSGCTFANNFIGGPDSAAIAGHTGINTVTPRAMFTTSGSVANDPYLLPANTTPVLDLSASNIQQYECPTAGAALTPTAANLVPGQTLTVIFVQNSTTACTWAWPASFHGGGTVTTTLGGISAQQFVVSSSGTDAYAVGAMQSTTGGTP